jgi:hypothetical protein
MFAERGPNETIFYTHGELVAHKVIDGDDWIVSMAGLLLVLLPLLR